MDKILPLFNTINLENQEYFKELKLFKIKSGFDAMPTFY